jgi:hypothetical protein
MKIKKIKKKFARDEMIRLERRVAHVRSIVDDVLKEEFGRRLYRLKREDELRLLVLLTWKERYKVSVKWILKFLIPIWSSKFAKYKTKTSLGCRVATLVGKRSEEIIRERLDKEFPHQENIRDYKERERIRLVEKLSGESNIANSRPAKYFSPIDAPTVDKFVDSYRKEIRCRKNKKLKHKESYQLNLLKKKPYRTNPYL